MSPGSIMPIFRRSRFSRVSGDEPLRLTDDLDGTVFSPRERG